MARKRTASDGRPCWRGKDDPSPYVPGIPAEVPQARSLRALSAALTCCTRCELAAGRTQVVVGTGPVGARLMLIGEGPGAAEDKQGRPFVGASGRLVERLLAANGLSREEVYITNVVGCRPPGNRAPKTREVQAHAPWLEEQLRLVAPAVVMTLGRTALIYFLPGAKITQLRGQPQRIAREGREILWLPSLHPAAALRRREHLPSLEHDFAMLPELLRSAAGG